VFGIWKGLGYCLCTDWHLQVREAMGIQDRSTMYVQLLIDRLTGVMLPDMVVVAGTGAVFAIALVLSIAMNLRDRKRRVAALSASNPSRS
jgi:hypothetical protein